MYAARLHKLRNRIASSKVIPRRDGDHERRSIKTSQRSNVQWWTIANLDMRQRINNQGSNEMLDLFFSGPIYTALRLLTVPTKPYDPRSARQPMLTDRSGKDPTSVQNLYPGSWAGSRIICLGDDSEEIPSAFTEEEVNEIWKYRPKSTYPFCGDPSLFIWGRYSVADSPQDRIWVDPEFYLTRSEVWVLRNLTSLEYVRSDAIPTSDNWDRQLRYELQTGLEGAPGLAQVLLMRIAWSTSENIGYLAFPRLHQGPWAGDRMDVQSYKNAEKGMKEGGWKDVSADAARDLSDLWKYYWEDVDAGKS